MSYLSKYNEVVQLLEEHSDADNAKAMAKYMRDQFSFYGIKSPLRKELVRHIKAVVPVTEDPSYQMFITLLWDNDHRECQYIALDLLKLKSKKLDKLWIDYLENLILTKSWWDTVDFLAPLLGNIFSRNITLGHSYTDKWIASDNIWLQRSALIYQLKYKDAVDADRLYRYILKRKDSKEFFVQKGAGWALRQYSKFNPESVRQFLDKHSHELAKLTVREGSRML